MKTRLRSIVIALSLVFVTTTAGTADEVRFDTPQRVFHAAQSAGYEGRPLDVMRCMTADSLEAFAVLAAEALVGLDQLAEQYKELTVKPEKLARSREELAKLLADYGLPQRVIAEIYAQHASREARLAQLGAKITDYPGLMIALAKHGIYDVDPKEFKFAIVGELVAVESMGDTAVGRVIETPADGSRIEKQFEFRRVNGSWRIYLAVPLERQHLSE